MVQALPTFVPVAVLLSITPGAATALVVRNAARGGLAARVPDHLRSCSAGGHWWAGTRLR